MHRRLSGSQAQCCKASLRALESCSCRLGRESCRYRCDGRAGDLSLGDLSCHTCRYVRTFMGELAVQ